MRGYSLRFWAVLFPVALLFIKKFARGGVLLAKWLLEVAPMDRWSARSRTTLQVPAQASRPTR